jgi:hypothetical protein
MTEQSEQQSYDPPPISEQKDASEYAADKPKVLSAPVKFIDEVTETRLSDGEKG